MTRLLKALEQVYPKKTRIINHLLQALEVAVSDELFVLGIRLDRISESSQSKTKRKQTLAEMRNRAVRRIHDALVTGELLSHNVYNTFPSSTS
jgi:dethiobiotin synthetase